MSRVLIERKEKTRGFPNILHYDVTAFVLLSLPRRNNLSMSRVVIDRKEKTREFPNILHYDVTAFVQLALPRRDQTQKRVSYVVLITEAF
jgi:hypothetical protein